MTKNASLVAFAAAVACLLAPRGTIVPANAVETGGPAAAPQGTTLAWIRFSDAPETYAGVPYHWLGRTEITLSIDVRPAAGQRLELLWGSKQDQRDAVVVVNGKPLRAVGGGYDGFRWLRVPLPEKLAGDRYEIALRRGTQRPAFLAEVRLTAPAPSGAVEGGGGKMAAHKIAMKRTPIQTETSGGREAFPEMRAFWDQMPPEPARGADARIEALYAQAFRNGRMAAEALYRCHKFVEGWLATADPKTGLIARNLNRDRDIWNAKDAAADNYPFMVLTCAITDREMFEGRMLDMLRTETRLTSRVGRMPDTYSFSKQAFLTPEPRLADVIFGSSEYIKDGLLPLTEWLGPSPWSERMLGILDDLWKHAPIETPFGNIPSENVEVNGEMLQALSRIYWMTGERKYLDWAMRLGDYYLLGNHHPTRDLDDLRLRDHGCEIISGLSELYVAVSFALPEKKKAYKEPIHAVFDRVLEIGRDEHGMLYNTIHPKTGGHQRGICDTWGYNYNGVYAVYMVDRTESYRGAVRHVLSNLEEHLTDYNWGSADEFADSIEGAINLINREPDERAARWIDSEIRDMWSKQQPDGVIEGWHGDGNSARTSIMFATWKTQGLLPRPWRADVALGAARQGDTIYVSLSAEKPYRGTLIFDRPRHREVMHLPLDYPRINQFPEWFTVEADAEYVIRRDGKPEGEILSGKQLREGVPVELKPGEQVRIAVAKKQP